MDYINCLIYPVAGLLALLAIGGISGRHPVVVTASIFSMALNVYAIISFSWWPIAASIAVDLIFKKLFGDPGAPS